MSHNSFGHAFRVTTWGESRGPAIGCVVDGCPPRSYASATPTSPMSELKYGIRDYRNRAR